MQKSDTTKKMNYTNNQNETGALREAHELPERKKRLFNKARDLSLSPSEKTDGLVSLQNFMESKPKVLPVGSPYFNNIAVFLSSVSIDVRKKILVPVALLVVFALAAGTTYAASESLPGDILYTVKINVNEQIETALALGDEARVKVAVSHAENRLEEAERLAEKGNLMPSVQADLVAKFNREIGRVASQTENLKTNGRSNNAEKLNTKFEDSLRAHSTVIAGIAGKSKSNGKKAMTASSSVTSNEEGNNLSEIKAAVDVRLDVNKEKKDNSNNGKKPEASNNSGGVFTHVTNSVTAGNGSATETANSSGGATDVPPAGESHGQSDKHDLKADIQTSVSGSANLGL